MPKKLSIYSSDAPILKGKADAVSNPEDKSIQLLIENMLYTVAEHDGIGISAPQVGTSKRIIIVASRPNSRYPYAPEVAPEAMINPVILSHSEEQALDWEGCLSVPNARGKVPRAKSIELSYTSRTGQHIVKPYEGFLARIIQHEIDHLDGITFVERMETGEETITEQAFLEQIGTSSEKHVEP